MHSKITDVGKNNKAQVVSASENLKTGPIPSHRIWRLTNHFGGSSCVDKFIQSGGVVVFEYIDSLKQIALSLGRVVFVADVPNLFVAFSILSGWLHSRSCKQV